MAEQVTTSQPAAPSGRYEFVSPAEADATYFVLAWFAITELAALGIFPLLSALNHAYEREPAYFGQFFENGFRHFKDEQRHANLWCRALLDFSKTYPEVISRKRLPQRYLKIMLNSVAKPHSVLNFGIDCLAFEVVMQALYDVAAPRLSYPPLRPIFDTISRDEVAHTDFDNNYVAVLTSTASRYQKVLVGIRYWRNTAGVLLTIGPLLDAIDRVQAMPRHDFYQRLAFYQRQARVPAPFFGPKLIEHLR